VKLIRKSADYHIAVTTNTDSNTLATSEDFTIVNSTAPLSEISSGVAPTQTASSPIESIISYSTRTRSSMSVSSRPLPASPQNATKSALSTNAKTGIGIAAAIGAIVGFLQCFILFQRRQRRVAVDRKPVTPIHSHDNATCRKAEL
jgi:hypothetical protein